MTGTAVIAASDLSRSFGELTAIDGVTLTVAPGESIALVGPNGAGKSTLIRVCLGLLEANAGHIEVLGINPRDHKFDKAKGKIGFLPEQVQFHGALSARQTLSFYAALKRADVHCINELLDRVRLNEAADRSVATYSKGMRQRLGLAQALIGEPHLLLLDEPMTGLDPEARANFFRILDEERARGAAIILSSHVLTELEARTDRVAILSRGQLKAVGSVDELRGRLKLGAQIRVRASPAQIQLLSEQFACRFDAHRFVNGVAVLECDGTDKIMLLRELLNSQVDLDDIEMIEPGLENIFAAFTAGGSLT